MTQDFILKIRIALAKHKKTQKWLAEQIQISDAYMSDIMNGRRSPGKQVVPITTVLESLEKEESK